MTATRISPPNRRTTGEIPGRALAGAGIEAGTEGTEGIGGGAKVGGAGTEGIAGITPAGTGKCTACADAGEGATEGWRVGVGSDGVCITRVYSPGPLCTGGSLCSGRGTGAEATLNLGATGSAANSGEGNVCLDAPPAKGKSLGESAFGCVRKSRVNSPAEGGAAGGWMSGGEGRIVNSDALAVSRFPVCAGS